MLMNDENLVKFWIKNNSTVELKRTRVTVLVGSENEEHRIYIDMNAPV